MTLNRTSIALLAALTTAAAAQTSTTATKPVVHHTATTTHRAAPVANPKDAPPNVPKVVGTPKPLYSLRYIDTVIGTGPLSEPHKFYTVHYTGWLTDGTKFDSSVDRGEPITFPYGARQVIAGWDTGFEGMHVGGKRRLYIPYQLAYGENGRPPVIPAKAELVFDVEFIAQGDEMPKPKAPPAPPTTPAPAAAPAKPATPPPADTPASTTPPPASKPQQ